eukprot:3728111-Pyramimonas_sp.AAC.1
MLHLVVDPQQMRRGGVRGGGGLTLRAQRIPHGRPLQLVLEGVWKPRVVVRGRRVVGGAVDRGGMWIGIIGFGVVDERRRVCLGVAPEGTAAVRRGREVAGGGVPWRAAPALDDRELDCVRLVVHPEVGPCVRRSDHCVADELHQQQHAHQHCCC